jgi:hypothetical protein
MDLGKQPPTLEAQMPGALLPISERVPCPDTLTTRNQLATLDLADEGCGSWRKPTQDLLD